MTTQQKQQTQQVVYLQNVRISFPHLAEMQVRKNNDGTTASSYNCEFLLPPDHPSYAAFISAAQALAVEKWTNLAPAVMNQIAGDRKLRCYGKGEEKLNQTTMLPYDGYGGNFYISASSKTQPRIVDSSGQPAANTMQAVELARLIYAGCFVNAAVKPWLQENKHGRGIRADLVAVQFLRDGEPFGAGELDISQYFGQVAQQPQATPNGMFGQPQATPNGMFGQPQATPNGMFGQPQTTPIGMFG